MNLRPRKEIGVGLSGLDSTQKKARSAGSFTREFAYTMMPCRLSKKAR